MISRLKLFPISVFRRPIQAESRGPRIDGEQRLEQLPIGPEHPREAGAPVRHVSVPAIRAQPPPLLRLLQADERLDDSRRRDRRYSDVCAQIVRGLPRYTRYGSVFLHRQRESRSSLGRELSVLGIATRRRLGIQ